MNTLESLELTGKNLLIRADLNVPIKEGEVASDLRIVASLPTIRYALENGASVMMMSHLGRPTEGEPAAEFSLAPVAAHMSDDEALARQYASLCDIFVMDAFGTAHRAQASTHGVAKFAPQACAGPLLSGELQALGKALDNPARPLVAVVGGSKVSTKLTVLESLSGIVDQSIVGGGIANTFIAAEGHAVGKSLYEEDLIAEAQKLRAAALAKNGDIPVPTDVVCGQEFSESTPASTKAVDKVEEGDMIFDVGPETAQQYAELLKNAGTIVWNGPVGVFEFPQFADGTRIVGEAIAQSNAFSIAGGGDTLAAVDQFGLTDNISYISTGGGAFLEFLEGKVLPAVAVLEQRAKDA